MSVVAEHKQGMLFMLVGPGGVGKNAILDQLLKRVDNLKQLATATTRPPRRGEEHGKQRWFVTLDEFKQMIADDKLVEYQEVHAGVYYGVPKHALESAFAAGQDLIADIDFHGATKIRAMYLNNTFAFFVAPPNMDLLLKRLEARQDDAHSIQDRLNRAPEEMLYATEADFVIVNWNLDDAVNQAILLIRQIRQNRASVLPNITTTFTSVVTVPKTAQSYTSAVPKGVHPTEIARKMVCQNGVVNFDPDHLFFDDPPVVVHYDQHKRHYSITYQFRYEDK